MHPTCANKKGLVAEIDFPNLLNTRVAPNSGVTPQRRVDLLLGPANFSGLSMPIPARTDALPLLSVIRS